MKRVELKREHFRNGANFAQDDFEAYVAASEKYAKSFGIKYLSCVAGGILLGLLFSSAGGFAGNMLAVVAVFAGLIVGAAVNAPALKAVNSAAQKLGITRADISEARRYLKNGTLAWQGEPCTAGTVASRDGAQATPRAIKHSAGAAQTNFARATKLLIVVLTIWLAGIILFLLPLNELSLLPRAFFNLVYAFHAAGIYLLCFAQGKRRGAGVAAVVASLIMRVALGLTLIYVYSDRTAGAVTAQFVPTVVRTLLYTGMTVGGALLGKRGNRANATARAGFFAAGAFLVYGLINGIVIGGNATTFLVALFDAALFAGFYFLTVSLCNMQQTALRLHGLGLAWCWFAVIGAGAAAVLNIVLPINTGSSLDVFQIILSGFLLTGYILLLRRRTVGLYFVLYGAAVVMATTLLASLKDLLDHSTQPAQLISSVLALLNPLFAWLAVRAGKVETPVSPALDTGNHGTSADPDKPRPAPSAPGGNAKTATILDKYRAGLAYLDGCGTFDEEKFREFNRITGNRFSEADIQKQLGNAGMMINGMSELKSILRSTMTEGISTFEKLEQNGIDLSKYNL